MIFDTGAEIVAVGKNHLREMGVSAPDGKPIGMAMGVGSAGGIDVRLAHCVRGCAGYAGCEESGYVELLPDGKVVEDDDGYFGVEFHGRGGFKGRSLWDGKQSDGSEG